LNKSSNPDIAVFVVWSTQLGAQEKHAVDAMTTVTDERATHYWDPDNVIGRHYQALLHPNGDEIHLSGPAWDVWLLFDGTATWPSTDAPKPNWWEHQLRGMPDDVKLDPERFAAKASELAGDD
jgi:hypothetical protein